MGSNDVVDAYRSSHPLTRPDHYQSYVAQILAGDEAVLNAEAETMLAATSGTSGQRNILPYTPTMGRTFFSKGIIVIFDTLLQACPAAFGLQKTCKLAFEPVFEVSPGGLRIGPNSSGPREGKSFQRLLPLYSTPAAGYAIPNDEYAALYVHALFALRDRNLGIIEANFVSLPARLLRLIHRDGDALADDLAGGELGQAVANRLPPTTVSALNEALGGPQPQRAAEVRSAIGEGRHGLARRLWPKLRLFNANGTGAFATYAAKLRAAEGEGVPVISTLLAASEGLIGVSLSGGVNGNPPGPSVDGHATYCLVPGAMFFEFLPVVPAEDPVAQETTLLAAVALAAAAALAAVLAAALVLAALTTVAVAAVVAVLAAATGRYDGTLLAHELTVGAEYELVITNLGGLNRYRIGDVVKLVGFHERSPLVTFEYRIGQLLNLRGEKLSEPQFERALQSALRQSTVQEHARTSQQLQLQHQQQQQLQQQQLQQQQQQLLLLLLPVALGEYEYAVAEGDEEPPRYQVYIEPSGGAPIVTAPRGEALPTTTPSHGSKPSSASLAPALSPALAPALVPTLDTTLATPLHASIAHHLDAALCAENPVYATWRRKGAIGECEVHVVPSGGFEALRAQRLAEGASPQQLKVSRTLREQKHTALLREFCNTAARSA
eukprot:CAMPEP_0174762376 /NCGR_PEP_ID=MMETSP1094-20130205/109744_1 /TAXON_ID=156173 /ORGANISM="Chrysochromulina brevifilum, Strain UTEX LB 985" /LENGTH=663 /DNA_ID=CAMNT_0015968329 /DNA_START=70 /DNA_END=2062 /DNA_ORIENTATION=-